MREVGRELQALRGSSSAGQEAGGSQLGPWAYIETNHCVLLTHREHAREVHATWCKSQAHITVVN